MLFLKEKTAASPKSKKFLAENDLGSLEAARELCLSKGIDVDAIVKGVQPIAFENASWAIPWVSPWRSSAASRCL